MCIRRTITLSIVFLLGAFLCMGFSQELKVKSFQISEGDLIARTSPRNDLNDKPCAVIRVGIGLTNVDFGGNLMGEPLYKPGEYLVYMPLGNTELTVRHANYLPLTVRFADHGIHRLESGCTYQLSILSTPYTPQQETSMSINESNHNMTVTVGGVTFKMIYVNGGTFDMGSRYDQSEKPVHKVDLPSYYIGETEVTQGLWKAIMGTTVGEQRDKLVKKWPIHGEGYHYPMFYVSWEECQAFVDRLNSLTNAHFRLPTEAEWEFAARGGNQSRGYRYSGSNDVNEVAWYGNNSQGTSHPVASLKANELGIFDMSGNVSEWCEDGCRKYGNKPVSDPLGPTAGETKALRGGGHAMISTDCLRSSYRRSDRKDCRYGDLGFRLALSE